MVTPAWPRGAMPNGIVTYTAHLAPALRERGVRPVILTWQVAEDSQDDGMPGDVIDISRFQPRRGLVSRAIEKARRFLPGSEFGDAKFMIENAVRSSLDRFPIELVEMEEAFGLPRRVMNLRRVPVVCRLHGPWFLNGEVLGAKCDAQFARRIEQEGEAIAHADAVTAPSLDVLERTRAFYRLPLEAALVIPYPVDPGNREATWSLAECDRSRLVFIGRFDRHKGADVMIDAFARLAASRPELMLDFVGPDRGIPDASGRNVGLVEYLESHVLDPHVRRRIVVHGPKQPDEANAFRRRGFITIVPSRYETFGYTAVEAMSLGCPLIAANSGGLAEIVRDGQTGLLFRSSDPQSLAAQITRLLDAPQIAATLGAEAARDVRQRYNPLSIADQTLDFYAQVVEHWRGRSHRPEAVA